MAGSRKNNRDIETSKLTQRRTKKQQKNISLQNENEKIEQENRSLLVDELETIHEEEEKIINNLSVASWSNLSFYINILFAVRMILAPVCNVIRDSDETYNSLEPINYMIRMFGKQTWEYSPVYGLRSWFYLLPFYNILTFALKIINKFFPIWTLFYLVRLVLGYLMFKMESSLAIQLGANFNISLAKIYLVLTTLNSGIFHAGIELLPSTVALYCMTLSINHFLKYKIRSILSDKKSQYFNKACFCIFVGGIMGWAYVLVLGIPYALMFILEYRSLIKRTPENSKFYNIFFNKTILKILKYFIPLVGVITFVDSQIYSQLSPVFVNTIYYNVLRTGDKPISNFTNAEPWYFYILNLASNFPLITIAGCFASAVGVLHWEILQILWPIVVQFFIWVVIFAFQANKQEKFMYPVYSHIVLMASLAVFYIYSKLSIFGTKFQQSSKIAILGVTILQVVSRVYANYSNNYAVLEVYQKLNYVSNDFKDTVNVCVGREWKRFPGSFFLPENFRLKFIKSEFDGLLPGDFPELDETANITNWSEGAKKVPSYINKNNLFDEGTIVNFDICDYLVDVKQPYTAIEAQYVQTERLKEIFCSPIIDAAESTFFGKVYDLPFLSKVSKTLGVSKYYKTHFDDYCLFRVEEK
ncbi:hypothetical protein QEN19_004267 [Hanseniaspora menglaensis]